MMKLISDSYTIDDDIFAEIFSGRTKLDISVTPNEDGKAFHCRIKFDSLRVNNSNIGFVSNGRVFANLNLDKLAKPVSLQKVLEAGGTLHLESLDGYVNLNVFKG